MASPFPPAKEVLRVMRLKRKGYSLRKISKKIGRDHKRVHNMILWGEGRKTFEKSAPANFPAHAKKIRELVRADAKK